MLIHQMKRELSMLALLVLGGCATLPTGPSVLVLPAAGKPFDMFQVEDATCRQWAGRQIGMPAQDAANQHVATGAAVGTVVGAGAGALIGAAAGDPALGAAIGAGSGLLVGTSAGANASEAYGWEAQRRYDHSYMQCMYANGNQIPGRVQRYRVRNPSPATPPPPNMTPVPPDYVPTPR